MRMHLHTCVLMLKTSHAPQAKVRRLEEQAVADAEQLQAVKRIAREAEEAQEAQAQAARAARAEVEALAAQQDAMVVGIWWSW